MNKMLEYIRSKDAKSSHPIARATDLQFKFVSIFPFTEHSGRTGRMLMNYLLMREGYPIAIIDRTERQRYYESFRDENFSENNVNIVLDALRNTISLSLRFLKDYDAIRKNYHI